MQVIDLSDHFAALQRANAEMAAGDDVPLSEGEEWVLKGAAFVAVVFGIPSALEGAIRVLEWWREL